VDNVCADVVEEVARVRDDDQRLRPRLKVLLEPQHCSARAHEALPICSARRCACARVSAVGAKGAVYVLEVRVRVVGVVCV
jgi:hypothetical protein